MAHALNPSKQEAGGSLLVEASLVYTKEFQDNQGYIEKPYLKNKITTNKNKTKRLLSLPSVIQCSQLISTTRMASYLDISGKACIFQATVLAYSQRLSGQSHILASRSVWGWWSVLEDYGVYWLRMWTASCSCRRVCCYALCHDELLLLLQPSTASNSSLSCSWPWCFISYRSVTNVESTTC